MFRCCANAPWRSPASLGTLIAVNDMHVVHAASVILTGGNEMKERRPTWWGGAALFASECYIASRISRARAAAADGVLPTLTTAASSASWLACSVREEPETSAPRRAS